MTFVLSIVFYLGTSWLTMDIPTEPFAPVYTQVTVNTITSYVQYPGNGIEQLKTHNGKYLLMNLKGRDATRYSFEMRWSDQLGSYPGDGIITWSDWSTPFMVRKPINAKPTIIEG